MLAPVNKIIKFSNVDGPGNRMTIFFQSCPFNCLYCHNPETINYCIHCMECTKTCPTNALSVEKNKVVWNKSLCVDCDTCIKVCKHKASPKITMMSVEEIVELIKRQKAFIKGITVSGGECMVHHTFLLELFKEVKKLNLTCLIDSNGYYNFENHLDLLEVCDGVMLDIKAFDNEFHQTLVFQPNNIVIKNLNYLLSQNKLQEVRTVVLPVHHQQNIITVDNVSKIIKDKTTYKLLRYRPYGVLEENLKFLSNESTTLEMAQELQKLAIENGATNTIVI